MARTQDAALRLSRSDQRGLYLREAGLCREGDSEGECGDRLRGFAGDLAWSEMWS